MVDSTNRPTSSMAITGLKFVINIIKTRDIIYHHTIIKCFSYI